MIRDVNIEDITDGKFYKADDYVPVGCHDCEGCSQCCQITGDSIILDPMDMYRLTLGLGRSFEEMIEKEIEIRMVDGMILPNLMEHDEEHPEKTDGCPFLNTEGRCSIHSIRPGFCRMFPMGRYYEKRSFRYILQVKECPKTNRYPVKLRDWLDMPELEKYEAYVNTWHYFLKDVSEAMALYSEEKRMQAARFVLQMFYVQPYRRDQSFYVQFEQRLAKAKKVLPHK
ncbi:MAG: YkgJ family cysteine cluster protein [Eubacteriales bacterium]|nr:YkgJ family cysteine cluster protein [Eubacteriales bacterium]